MKRVCIIHAYPSEYILKSAADLGYQVVLVNPDPSLGKRFEAYLEDQIVMPLFDDEAVVAQVAQYHQTRPFHVILPANEITVVTCAKVAAHLGLKGNPVEAAELGRDKYLMARCMQSKGVPCPKTIALSDPWIGGQQIQQELGYPAIIKLSDSMNSQGVIKVRNEREYIEQIGELLALLDVPLSISQETNRNRISYGRSKTPIIAQSYCSGREVNIDLVFDETRCLVAGFFEKEEMSGPYFAEKASMSPTSFNEEEIALLSKTAELAARALGAQVGSAHVEIKYDPTLGPFVIEVGLRPGGGLTLDMMEYMTGANVLHFLLDSLSGERALPEQMPPAKRTCLYGGVIYPRSGRITKISGMEILDQIEEMLFYKVLGKEGDLVQVLPKSAQPHFVYYALGGESRQQVQASHVRIQQSVKVSVLGLDEAAIDESLLMNQGTQILKVLAEEYANSENRPVYVDSRDWTAARQAGHDLPMEGEEKTDVLIDHFFRDLFNGYTNFVSPGYMAYFGPRPHPITVLGDLIASGLNQAPGAWRGGPTSAQMETDVLGWMAQFLGFQAAAPGKLPNGIVTDGGSMANATALKCARDRILGSPVRQGGLMGYGKPRIYVSRDAHFSIYRSADLLGFGADSIRVLDFGEGQTPDLASLVAEIEDDRNRGFLPMALVATAGTTSTGFVEPIGLLTEVAAATGLWLHVDGASGAAYATVPGCEGLFEGLAHVDSITIDPCKFLMSSFGIGILLVRNGEDLYESFKISADYFKDNGELDTFQMGFRGTRNWRSLGLWLLFKHYGASGLRLILSRNLNLTKAMAAMMRHKGLEVYQNPLLPVCVFRFANPNLSLEQQNRFNEETLKLVIQSGEFYLSTVQLEGTVYLRATIDNYATQAIHITALANSLVSCANSVEM